MNVDMICEMWGKVKKKPFLYLYLYLLRALPVLYSSLNDCDSNVNEYTAYKYMYLLLLLSYWACYSDFHFVSFFSSLVQFIVSFFFSVWIRAHFRIRKKNSWALSIVICNVLPWFNYFSFFFFFLVFFFFASKQWDPVAEFKSVSLSVFDELFDIRHTWKCTWNISTTLSMDSRIFILIIYFHSGWRTVWLIRSYISHTSNIHV